MGYIDPGLFGLLSQIGVVFFLVIVTGFTFFSKTIKKIFRKIFKGGKEEIKPED
jgi:hypothetical protein